MHILQHQRKSPHLNTLERFYTHKEAALDNHLNYDYTVLPNKVFDTILRIQPPLPNHSEQKKPSPQLSDSIRETDNPATHRTRLAVEH
jgi:hypothetical protein